MSNSNVLFIYSHMLYTCTCCQTKHGHIKIKHKYLSVKNIKSYFANPKNSLLHLKIILKLNISLLQYHQRNQLVSGLLIKSVEG